MLNLRTAVSVPRPPSHGMRPGERSLRQLDPGAQARRPQESFVAGNERRGQRFRERHLDRVVRSHVVPKLPDPVQQGRMRVSFDVEIAPAIERPPDASVFQQSVEYVSPQNLGYLDVYQMGCVDDFGFVLETG